jgi:flagellar hook-associated protein 3 FlgL
MVATLSTLGQSNLVRSEFTSLQGQIQQLQTQIATTQKAQVFGDLGTQASLDINLRQQADVVNDFKNSVSQVQVRTGLVDTSLGIINTTALAVKNEAFQTPTFPTQRIDLVSAAKSAIDQITQRLQTAVDGRNLFGGTQTQTDPIVGSATLLPQVQAAVNTALNAVPPPANIPAAIQAAVAGVFATTTNFYAGGPPHPPTQIDQGLTVDDSITAGDPTFQTILTGLYTLASLPQPVGQTATPPNLSNDDFDTTASAAASLISGGLTQLSTLVQKNGRNEKILTDESNTHDATLTILQTQIDNIENVDIADASTRLSQLKTQLDASFHVVADLNNLSLVDLLK